MRYLRKVKENCNIPMLQWNNYMKKKIVYLYKIYSIFITNIAKLFTFSFKYLFYLFIFFLLRVYSAMIYEWKNSVH